MLREFILIQQMFHQTPTKINKQGTTENSKESEGYTKFNNTVLFPTTSKGHIIIGTIKSRCSAIIGTQRWR